MISFCSIITSVLLLSFSSSPPLARTGAPGEGLCSQCHSSNPAFTGTLEISGIPATIDPETTYPISIIVTREDAVPLKAGFQLVALNGNNINIGTLGNAGSNVTFENSGIRNYAQHLNAKSFGTDDVITYNFDWTSPEIAGHNTITFYAASVLANGNGSSFNDKVLTQTRTSEFIGPQGDPLEVIITNVVDVNCNGTSTGSATAVATGGISPYIYNWSNGDTDAELNNVMAGTYTVTVSDQLGESTSASVTIVQPGALSIQQIFSQDITCSNPAAQINVMAAGGVEPYNYAWSNGATGNEITVTDGGNYVVTVTDQNSCTSTLTVFILANNQVPVISAGVDQSIFCANGSVQLMGTGPIDPEVVVSWSTFNGNIVSGADTYTPTVNQAGEYQLTVFDEFTGCTAMDTVLVFGEPTPVEPTGIVTNISCNGNNDGSISLNPIGGAGGYTYQWSNGSNNQLLSNLAPGTYAVTVSDAFGCTGTSSFTITQPAALTISTSSTPITGPGENDASITATASGGTASYMYVWSNSGTGATISNLGAGTYTVTATDMNGCTATKSVVISPFDCNLQIDSIVVTHQICPNTPDAAIEIIVSGGIAPVNFTWADGASTHTRMDLMPGTYYVTVMDAQGCSVEDSIVIIPSSFNLSLSSVNPSGIGLSDGSVTANATGGSSPYTYLWNNGATTTSLEGLPAGTYSISVTDSNGCTLTATAVLVDGNCTLNVEVTEILAESCAGSLDGSIAIEATGGTAPYTYEWSNGQTTSIINNLMSGQYYLTVTDAEDCIVTDSVFVSLDFDFTVVVMPSTDLNNPNGSITVHATGGVPPYTYIWSNGETTASINNLVGGQYSVTVSDSDGCSGSTSVIVSEVNCTLDINLAVRDSILCNGDTGFLIIDFISEGTPPYTYTYSWTPGIIGSQFEVIAGVYSVTVADNIGCTSVDTVEITQPDELEYQVVAFTPQIGMEGSGKIEINISGGTGNYSITWSYNGAPFSQTTASIGNLNSGIYSAIVTDANGCILVTEIFEILLGTSTRFNSVEFPFQVYPNPALDHLMVSGSWDQRSSLIVRDATGKVISGKIIDSHDSVQILELENMTPGFYILTIAKGANYYHTKFIKQ